MMKSSYLIHIYIVAGLIFSCGTPSRISQQNIANQYRKEVSLLHPDFITYHSDDNTTKLFYKLFSDELLYTKTGTSNEFTCTVKISYVLKPSYESKEIVDSATVIATDSYAEQVSKTISGSINLKCAAGNKYLLEIWVVDVKRNQEYRALINVVKQNKNTAQNYLIKSASGEVSFKNYFKSSESFLLKNNQSKTNYFVRYYKRDFPLAPPPFSIYNPQPFEYKADSVFTLSADSLREIVFPQLGFYHIQFDTSTTDGLTIYRFEDAFPKIKSANYLLKPLRYLTSKYEYNQLDSYSNKKAAVDSFWVSCGGSVDRARELIKKFYNRMEDANGYFSSYVEGWQTDRGLMYLIYGPPNIMYRNTTSETWVYGEENNVNSMQFIFYKVDNPFTDNDFRLDRNPSYKDSWYRAVDSWRQGRIFIDN
jgi:GWxTD domain-containing protein